MTKTTRTETDSFGPLEVPADKYWGAQTQRSIQNFPIGWERQPVPIIRALGAIKQAAAEVNMAAGKLDPAIGKAMVQAPRKSSRAGSMTTSRWWSGRPARARSRT